MSQTHQHNYSFIQVHCGSPLFFIVVLDPLVARVFLELVGCEAASWVDIGQVFCILWVFCFLSKLKTLTTLLLSLCFLHMASHTLKTFLSAMFRCMSFNPKVVPSLTKACFSTCEGKFADTSSNLDCCWTFDSIISMGSYWWLGWNEDMSLCELRTAWLFPECVNQFELKNKERTYLVKQSSLSSSTFQISYYPSTWIVCVTPYFSNALQVVTIGLALSNVLNF